jgi:energy-coupling factor transporter ATP-binding protein EcfA2
MDRFGLARFRDRAPWSLSGGEKASVLLAAALAAEPRALLLDQSLAHLDPSTRRSLEHGLVAEALGGARLLVRTHQDWDPPGSGEVLHVIEHGALGRVDLAGPGPWNASVPYPLALRAAAILRTRGRWDGPLATTNAELGAGIRRTAGADHTIGADDAGDAARGRDGHTDSPRVPSAGGDPVISLSGVSWSPGGRGPRLLAPLDLEVRQGEVVALVGRSGSGKSTVLKLAAGLLDPTSGSVTVRGRPGPGRPAGLALEYPERQLFGRTVGEDVAALLWVAGVAERERRDRARAALATVGLDPDAFESRIPATLSEGEKRRAAIAALLADAPTALLLDEPTAGLDPEGRASLARVIAATRAEGRAVLLASHDLDFVSSVADRVVLLGRDREGEATALAARSPREAWSDPQLLGRAGLPAPDFLEIEETLRGGGLLWGRPARDGAALLNALERCIDAPLRRSAPGNPASVGSEA